MFFSYDIFYLLVKVSPLEIALGEILLIKIYRQGLELEDVGWKIFEKLFSGAGCLFTWYPRVHNEIISSKLLAEFTRQLS